MKIPVPRPGAGRATRLWEQVRSGSGAAWGERLTGPIHDQLADALGLAPGRRVLDIGCGDGAYFPTIRNVVGPTGHVHGIDASHNMIARAQARITEHGWDNVVAEQADFTRYRPPPAGYDAALAIFAISAMADVPAAVNVAHHALLPDGRLFVVDVRLTPRGPTAPLIGLARLAYRAAAGWSGVEVLDAVQAGFPVVEVRRGQQPSWPPVIVLTARKGPGPTPI